MFGTIFKVTIGIIVVLALWKLAGGTPEGVASLLESVVTKIGGFLGAVSDRVAGFFGHFLSA